MQIYRWNEIAKQQLHPLATRQVIHGEFITLARFEIRAGYNLPEHSHPNEQFSAIQSGAVRFNIGGEERIVRAGESVRIPPHVPHSAAALEDSIAIETFSPPRDDWK